VANREQNVHDYLIKFEEKDMPYINIKVTDEGVTKEQKRKLIAGATQLMVDILNKNPNSTFVVIDEVNTDNWGVGSEMVTDLRQRES